MQTKIIKTVKEWLPWFSDNEAEISEYELLNNMANFCRQQMEAGEIDKVGQVIKIVNLIYSNGTLHEKNAIENEFLEVLALFEAPASLKSHLHIFPVKLKEAYLKTILEN
ncbi:MAG: hypothetical protein IPN72_17285 [Saprospiraceae bacterium]|nr:hypothetical protein [Saprospiraceae bacterium]